MRLFSGLAHFFDVSDNRLNCGCCDFSGSGLFALQTRSQKSVSLVSCGPQGLSFTGVHLGQSVLF